MSFGSDIWIQVKEVFSGNDGFILICDYFDDSVIKECLQTRIGPFYENEFSVAEPTSCFSPPKQRAIHIRTKKDLTQVTEILFRNKEIEEGDFFEGYYVTIPEHPGFSPPTEYNIGALAWYMRKNKKSFVDLTKDEIEQFRIENEKAADIQTHDTT